MVRLPAEPGRRHRRRRDHPCVATTAVALRGRARLSSGAAVRPERVPVRERDAVDEGPHRGVRSI
jgi:hypothetical protein